MLNNIIIRLAVYYITWLLILNAVFHIFPEILHYVAQERQRIFVGTSFESGVDAAVPLGNIKEGINRLADPEHTIPVVVALVLAFAVTLPITWVYAWTHSSKKYSQSFVQTLLVIPVAISLVVFLVKGSLALAFSLAGIVAAVTFRLSLKSTIEGVVHVYGHRDRAGGWHPAYDCGLPRIVGFRHHNTGRVENQLWRAATSTIRLENCFT